MNANIQIEDPKRTETLIEPVTNTMGTIVALWILSRSDVIEREGGIKPFAKTVLDDLMYGDHIRISGHHHLGENIGGELTRYVVIHNSPKTARGHSVRFVNFDHTEEHRHYNLENTLDLAVDVLHYLTTGDFH